jgi:DNA-directed RNA polymerase specialized sigma24 family protein
MTGVVDELEELVAAAAVEDEQAWQALWARVEPALSRILAQPHFLGRLAHREDDRASIAVAVMARLRERRFHRLQMYLDAKRANPRLRFASWLRVVVKRVAIDYLRANHDPLAGTLHTGDAHERPPITNRGTARELLRHAADVVPADQLRALEMWTHSDSFADIAATLGMTDAAAAERAVRAALERLRRAFRP